MKLNLIPALAAGLLATAPAFAADVVIDFDTPESHMSIGDYYNGDVLNYGVSFGLDALALQNVDPDPFFSNNPSPVGVMAVTDVGSTMNFAAGFTAASFWYSTTDFAVVSVYSGLDGTGTRLAAFALVDNAQTNGCSDAPYCNWSYAAVAFNGIAQSITFGDAVGAGIDNLTISAVPEPSEAVLLGLGLAGVLLRARRRDNKLAA